MVPGLTGKKKPLASQEPHRAALASAESADFCPTKPLPPEPLEEDESAAEEDDENSSEDSQEVREQIKDAIEDTTQFDNDSHATSSGENEKYEQMQNTTVTD